MVNNSVNNSPSSVQSKGMYISDNSGSGLDATLMIQLLLMRDCDEQLKALGQEMKINNKLKACYREEIKKYKSALTGQACESNGKVNTKDNSKNTSVKLQDSSSNFSTVHSFHYNPKTKEIDAKVTQQFGKLDIKSETVDKKQLETLIECLSDEKDNLNDAQEIVNMQIQTLTNLRKCSLETASNCISKENEGNSSIIRNMRG